MTLPSSGTISLNQIHVEAGGSSGSTASINDSDIRVLIGKSSEASMSFNEWYGASREITLPSLTAINGYDNNSDITASGISGLVAGGILIIPEDFYLWSSSAGAASLIIDLANITVQNSGFIVGKGGTGQSNAGGPAISITASGVTIINNSGAYIAGGGGSGGQGRNGGPGSGAGGGGQTGTPTLGAAGANGANNGGTTGGRGGGAGGGSASVTFEGGAGGGQGGYILPGSGGAGGSGGTTAGVSGGSGSAAGSQGNRGGNDAGGPLDSCGGGGGWGAVGGTRGTGATAGGAGGKGIEANSNSFTLTNNGTIYGAQS